MNIILYTIGCYKCKILEEKLKEKNISFTICDDESLMEKIGITKVPMLKVEDKMMDFGQAKTWVENYEN